MINLDTFSLWIIDALNDAGKQATILQVSKHIWKNHEPEMRLEDETFYKWQYKMRWAAKSLRDKGIMKPVKDSPKGLWELF